MQIVGVEAFDELESVARVEKDHFERDVIRDEMEEQTFRATDAPRSEKIELAKVPHKLWEQRAVHVHWLLALLVAQAGLADVKTHEEQRPPQRGD